MSKLINATLAAVSIQEQRDDLMTGIDGTVRRNGYGERVTASYLLTVEVRAETITDARRVESAFRQFLTEQALG